MQIVKAGMLNSGGICIPVFSYMSSRVVVYLFQGTKMGKCEPWNIYMHAMFRNPSESWSAYFTGIKLMSFDDLMMAYHVVYFVNRYDLSLKGNGFHLISFEYVLCVRY